jgi:uncharacterized repeat protein (TIGR03803 family)
MRGISIRSIITFLILGSTALVGGETLRTVCSFSETNGARPQAGLLLGNDGSFYGATAYGGDSGYGTAFHLTTNGALTTLTSFSLTNGAYPQARLTSGNDGNLYGTTLQGGITNFTYSKGMGTIFRVTTNGTLTTLAAFSGTNGMEPLAELTLGNDGNFYGTTASGEAAIAGTVFKVTTNGTLTTLFYFSNTFAEPRSGLALGVDGNYYGTTWLGGTINSSYPSGLGTIFKITPGGTMTTLAAFNYTNGANPQGTLVRGNDGNFYGTTSAGGSNDLGTIFKVTTDGALTSLVSFSGPDGAAPKAALTVGNNGDLYGTTFGNGINNNGTVFRLATNGALTTLATLYLTNANPLAGLTLGDDGNFYGTTDLGGTSNSVYPFGMGTIFSLPSPDVTIQPQRQAMIAGSEVTYYANVGGFGTPPFDFQWFFNGLPMADATNTSLTILNFDLVNAGAYSVTVSNQYGYDTGFRVLRLINSPIVLVDSADVGGGSVSRIASTQISMSTTFGSSAPIYYTLDGVSPSYLSIAYQGPFQLTRTARIRALAYDSAYVSSAEAAPITVQIVPTYRLMTSTAGGGSMIVSPTPYSGTDHFISKTLATITATPSNGWSFLGWLGDAAGASPTATVSMTRDMAVQALFGTGVTSNALGAGQIWFARQVPFYPYGAGLAVAAVPQSGSYLVHWAGALSGSNNPNTLVVTNPDSVVTALFGLLSPGEYALTAMPEGSGTVAVSPYTNRYVSGTEITLTAVPASGQIFTGWSGDATGSLNPLSVTMNQSKVIAASFTSRPTLSTTPPLNRMAEQGFRFSLSGELGITCQIYGSSNLSGWVPLGWLTNDFGTSQFLDTAALSNAALYYRAVTH